MQARIAGSGLLLVLLSCGSHERSIGTAEPAASGQQAVSEPFNHQCTLTTLPTTCGVPPEQLPCCAVFTPAGEVQMNCCPAFSLLTLRTCADGAPQCPLGGSYPNCPGVVCPALSSPCADGVGCCNECGLIGPKGCCKGEKLPFNSRCEVIGVPGQDICIANYDSHGRSVHVTLPDGRNAPP
jgi:hypothetical protein